MPKITNHDKIDANLKKLLAERSNTNKKWYEAILFLGAAAALLAVGKYLL